MTLTRVLMVRGGGWRDGSVDKVLSTEAPGAQHLCRTEVKACVCIPSTREAEIRGFLESGACLASLAKSVSSKFNDIYCSL